MDTLCQDCLKAIQSLKVATTGCCILKVYVQSLETELAKAKAEAEAAKEELAVANETISGYTLQYNGALSTMKEALEKLSGIGSAYPKMVAMETDVPNAAKTQAPPPKIVRNDPCVVSYGDSILQTLTTKGEFVKRLGGTRNVGAHAADPGMTTKKAAESIKNYVNRFKIGVHAVVHVGMVEYGLARPLPDRVSEIVYPLEQLLKDEAKVLSLTLVALPAPTTTYRIFNDALALACSANGHAIEFLDVFEGRDTRTKELFKFEGSSPRYTEEAKDLVLSRICEIAGGLVGLSKEMLNGFKKEVLAKRPGKNSEKETSKGGTSKVVPQTPHPPAHHSRHHHHHHSLQQHHGSGPPHPKRSRRSPSRDRSSCRCCSSGSNCAESRRRR